MVDVHTHILPGIDDGSKSVEMSIAMLREEQKQGIDTVVFTPHFDAQQNSPEEFLRRRNAAWDLLLERWTDETPRLMRGAQVQYFDGICEAEEIYSLCIEGTNILLLEMPLFKWTGQMIGDIMELQEHYGLKIMLAHIERYEKFYTKEMLDVLLRSGVLVQMSCSVFESFFSRRKALAMLKKGQVHLFGSDCHNLSDRAPTLGKWKKYIGALRAEELMELE